MNPQQEARRFRMHPDLLFSVIKNQCGTLAKAVLELVQNSMDAQATVINITLDRHSLRVVDDGNGFADETAINLFFETFGQPHTEGDGARWGRFRIGRGQLFAMGKNVWRSGEFKMSVDIKGKGLDYSLEKGLDHAPGCAIDAELYDVLSPSEILETERTLKEQCRYTPVPVFLNGVRLSEDVTKQKWTVITDDAYIRADGSRQLAVYNMGVLVTHLQSWDVGVGGVVISKVALEVNFARNDIIRNHCEVWKRIRAVLAKLAGDLGKKEKAEKRTDEWRRYQARRLMSWAGGSPEEFTEIRDLPIFTDIVGKHWSLDRLSNKAAKITFADKTLQADKVHTMKLAVVLNSASYAERFDWPIEKVLDHLATIANNCSNGNNEEWHIYSLRNIVQHIRAALVPFDVISSAVKAEHHPVDPAALSKEAKLAMRVIEASNCLLAKAAARAEGHFQPRILRAMESDTADAFTDGRSTIYIHLKFLKGARGPNRGVPWAYEMASLLIHEYAHAFDSGVGHTHDAEFLQAYHEAMQSPCVGKAIHGMFMDWPRLSKAELGKVTKGLAVQLDREAILTDRNGIESAAS